MRSDTAGVLLGAPVLVTTAAAQHPVAGTWRSETRSWWTSGWTVVFDVSGNSLTGAVTNCPRAGAVEIFYARIDAGTVRFTCRSEDGKSTIAFTGKVSGDRITLSSALQEPEPVPAPAYDTGERPGEIVVRRVSAGAGRLILDRLAERRRTTRPPFTSLTFDRIVYAAREPENWLTYSGSLQGGRHSSLTALTPGNVSPLELAWLWTSQSTGRFEATPLVVDGVLYTVQAPNDVVALDAISGEVLWTFKYTPAAGARATGGGGRPNRGLAMLGDRLFLGTLDAHVLAIDAQTGTLVWDTTVANSADPTCRPPNVKQAPCYVITHAPLVVKDKVLVGTGGGDGFTAGYGIRGLIAAYDAATGREVWRFHTIPGPGVPGHDTWSGDSWKTGRAGVWQIGTYDAGSNPDLVGRRQSRAQRQRQQPSGRQPLQQFAPRARRDTGALRWHYQFTPHDEMDWDAAQVPVLTPRSEWIPTSLGATNWHPASFSPATGLYYVSARERRDQGPGNGFGAVRAIDPTSDDMKWEFVLPDAWFNSGVLTTASNLLFMGTTGDNSSGPSASRQVDGYF